MSKIGILVIHGMGSQKLGFGNGLEEEVSDRLGGDADSFVWRQIHWADALKEREKELWRCMQTAVEPDGTVISLDWRRAREFVVHNFGDAIAYQRDVPKGSDAYKMVHTIVSSNVKEIGKDLPDAKAPIVVIAHSLGAQIMSDYIWDRQHPQKDTKDKREPIPNLVAMITFGCNIPLFSLGFPLAKPINLPGSGIKKPGLKSAAKWLNFLDRDDVLGWPLKPLYKKNLAKLNKSQKRTVANIEDYEINVGSLGLSWNPGAHAKYWTDNDFTRPVAVYLRGLLRAAEK